MKNKFLIVILIVSSVITLTKCKKNTDITPTPAPVVHWTKVSFPSSATVNFLKVNGTNLYAATNAGVFLSPDNDTNWTAINNGLPLNKNICALAFNGQNIYAGIRDSNAIFLSTNNGSNWVMSNNGIPYWPQNSTDHWIVGLYANGSDLFACTQFRGIYHSSDNASNWTEVNNGFELMSIGGYCGEPTITFNGANIFAGFKYCGANGSTSIYKSINNGSDWTHSSNGLPSSITIYSLASNAGNLFVTSDKGQIYKSTNNGDSWVLSNNGMDVSDQNIVLQLAFYGSVIYAGSSRGLYVSTDNGNTWAREEFHSEITSISTISSIAIKGSTLFIVGAGNQTWSIWKRSL